MPMARRDLLGLGAATAVVVATASCRAQGREVGRSSARSPSPPPARPAVSGRPPFPGRPPPGYLYYGASVPFDRSLPAWEAELGTALALNRSYFTPDLNETAQLVRRCYNDISRGRLPHVSIKAPSTWQDIARGYGDEWLTSMLRPLGRRSAPVFFTLHHEPENDVNVTSGMQPSDYVGMQRRVISLAAELAPQVVIVPVLQHWTFDPLRDDIDPAAWMVDEASVVGLDLYNPWSPTNGKPWRSFGSKVDEVRPWTGDTPLAIGEYGCRVDPENPGLAEAWMRDAADYARTHDIVSLSYFNSGVNSPDGPWTLTGETERAFAEILASDWVVRPA